MSLISLVVVSLFTLVLGLALSCENLGSEVPPRPPRTGNPNILRGVFGDFALTLGAALLVIVSLNLGISFIKSNLNPLLEAKKGAAADIYLTVILASGALGGLLYTFIDFLKGGRFQLCHLGLYPDDRMKSTIYSSSEPAFTFADLRIEFGSLGDVIVGMGSALAVFFVVAGTLQIDPTILSDWLRLVGLSVISGLGGRQTLTALRERFQERYLKGKTAGERAEKKTEELERKSNLQEASMSINRGTMAWLDKNFQEAQRHFQKALELQRENSAAYVGLGLVQSGFARREKDNARQRELFSKAIDYCTRAIELNVKDSRGYYNRACYRHKLSEPLQDVISDVTKALELEPDLREVAKDDPDLKDIDDPEFRKLFAE